MVGRGGLPADEGRMRRSKREEATSELDLEGLWRPAEMRLTSREGIRKEIKASPALKTLTFQQRR